MDTAFIMTYAGRCLDRKKNISAMTVQRYIMKQPEVLIAVSLEDIEFALGLLVTAGFLEVEKGDEFGSTYKRYEQPNQKIQ